MLLVTARDDAVPLPAAAGVRSLPLAGLNRDATATVVQQIVGPEASQDYIAEVHRRTGGNPFFTSEVARLQVSRGTPTGAIPPGVRQVLEHRLARLPQEYFDLLQVASVVGSPHIGILAGVTGIPETDVEARLVEPAAAGVIVDGAFAHDLMRETLYLGITPNRRAALHRQVAEHLQGGGPAELARHWSLASGEDARSHAAELALVAGDMAVAGLAHEQAIGHYTMALDLGAGGLDVRRRMGEAQVQAGHIGAGRDTLRLVARKALETEAAGVFARAVLAMGGGVGGFEVDVLDFEQESLLKGALRLLTDQDSALRAAVLARLSVASAAVASPDERASLADQAATLAEKAQSPNAEIMSWTLRFRIARLHHDTRAIGELAGQMVQWAEAYPSWDSAFALLFAESGEPERGRRHLRRLMDAGLDSLPVDSEWVELLWLLGEAAMLLDERDAVRAVYDALEPFADLWAVDGYGAACFGQVTDLLARFDEYLDRPSTTPRDWAAFIRTGTVWQVEFRGRSVTVVDSKGMRDLAVLLARPGHEIHVLELVEGSGGPSGAEAGTDTAR